MPLPRSVRISPGCVPGLNSSPRPRRWWRSIDRPECRLDHRQIDRREEIVTVADEARVLPYVNDDVRIPRRPARCSGVAVAAQSNLLAVMDPGRDPDVHGPFLDHASFAVAR